MKRDVETNIIKWYKTSNKALLITGARQVGKTYIVRKVFNELNVEIHEINFILRKDFKEILEKTNDIKEIVNFLKLTSNFTLREKESVIFFDEVQAYPEIMTLIKFLVDEDSFKYVLSGSLLGVELFNIRSMPVGYLEEIKMYPMNFFEFIKASGVNENTIAYLKKCFDEKKEIEESTHKRMLSFFYTYLITGGLPDVVKTLLNSGNLLSIDETQKNIVNLYKGYFSQYENKDKKLRIIEIFDNISSQLNKQNLKFIFTYLNKELKFDRYENSFLWLKDAGVAYPVFNVSEIRTPLKISKDRNSFKLFMNDVGLLNSYYSISIKQAIFEKNTDNLLNLGGLFENFVTQELTSINLTPYYFKNTSIGEIDFLVERDFKIQAIEVKSGKDYQKHKSLDKLITSSYSKYISDYFVFSTNNISTDNGVSYFPIYLVGFLKNEVNDNLIINIK